MRPCGHLNPNSLGEGGQGEAALRCSMQCAGTPPAPSHSPFPHHPRKQMSTVGPMKKNHFAYMKPRAKNSSQWPKKSSVTWPCPALSPHLVPFPPCPPGSTSLHTPCSSSLRAISHCWASVHAATSAWKGPVPSPCSLYGQLFPSAAHLPTWKRPTRPSPC